MQLLTLLGFIRKVKIITSLIAVSFIATSLNCQTPLFEKSIKYYESHRMIDFKINLTKDIHFLEFDFNSMLRLYDIDGDIIDSIKYDVKLVPDNKDSLSWEDLHNRKSYKLVVNDSITLGYAKRKSANLIVLNSPPIQKSIDEVESFSNELIKLRGTKIDLKECQLRKTFRRSKWMSTHEKNNLIEISKKNDKIQDQIYLSRIDDCIFIVFKKNHNTKVAEYQKYRVISLNKEKMVIEFTVDNDKGIVAYKRKK